VSSCQRAKQVAGEATLVPDRIDAGRRQQGVGPPASDGAGGSSAIATMVAVSIHPSLPPRVRTDVTLISRHSASAAAW
jgi:hypothetical protein